MPESRGMSIVRSGDTSILFRAVLFDSSNNKITSGTVSLRIWRIVPTTGAIETFDFDDDTFKTGAITTATANPSHQTAESGAFDTGVWTYRQTVLTNFTIGDKYIGEFSHASLDRPIQVEFQYGDLEGDQETQIPDAVWDEAISGHTTAGTFGEVANFLDVFLQAELKTTSVETAQTGTNPGDGTGTITLDAGQSATDGIFRGDKIVLVGGTGIGQSRIITDYTGSSKVAVVRQEWDVIPDNTTDYVIISDFGSGLAEEMWETDITGISTTDSAAVMLTALRLDNRTTGFNTLAGVLGVPDSVGATVTGDVWEELRASHNTAGTMGETMNNLNSLSTSGIADAVWDEDIIAAHGTANTAGLLLRALGAAISQRSNNATLNTLLGVPDTAGVNLVDSIWDEDIVAAHGTVDTAGLLIRALGAEISQRSNNATLNALLGVSDVASADVAWTILDEVVDGSNHTTTNSVGQRITAIDTLSESGGVGDLAVIKTQTDKLDSSALSGSPATDSVADKLDSITTTLATNSRQMLIAVNIEGTTLHIEVAVENAGVVETTPWTRAQAQIFDDTGSIITGGNISIGDFGAIGTRGFFMVDVNPHGVVAGNTYQIFVTIDDAGSNILSTTKTFSVISG